MVDSTSGANIIMQMANKPSVALEDPLKVAQEVENLRATRLSNKKNQFGMDQDQINFMNKNLAALLADPNISTEKALQQLDFLHSSGATPNEQAYQTARSRLAQAQDPNELRSTLGMMLQQIQSPETLLQRNTNSPVQYRNGGTTQFGTVPGANMPNAGIPSFAPSGSLADTPSAHNYDTGSGMQGVPGGVVGNQGPTGLPSPGTLDKTVTYTGKDNRTYPISEGELRYRRDNGIDMPADGGPPAGTFAQQIPPVSAGPGAAAGAAPGTPPATGGYTPRYGQAAPVAPPASGVPPPPGGSPIVTGAGALNDDGTVRVAGATAPQGGAPQGAAPQGPVVAPPPGAGPAVRTGLPVPTNNPITGQPSGLPVAGRTPTALGPSLSDVAEAEGAAGQVKGGWKTYQDLLEQAPEDKNLMTALRQAYDVSTLVRTGVGATGLNARASTLRTYAQALGVSITPEMKEQDVASAILNKSSANIVNFNPAAKKAVAQLESYIHGSPSAELPQGALREITLQMMGVVQMRNYLREVGQANPGKMLLTQRDAYNMLDPTAFVWDIMSRKERANYSGLLAADTNSAKAAARFIFTYNEMSKANMGPPGGLSANQQLPAGRTVPENQPNIFGTRNRLLGVPSRTGSNPLLPAPE